MLSINFIWRVHILEGHASFPEPTSSPVPTDKARILSACGWFLSGRRSFWPRRWGEPYLVSLSPICFVLESTCQLRRIYLKTVCIYIRAPLLGCAYVVLLDEPAVRIYSLTHIIILMTGRFCFRIDNETRLITWFLPWSAEFTFSCSNSAGMVCIWGFCNSSLII